VPHPFRGRSGDRNGWARMQPPAYADKNPLKYGTNLKSGTGFCPKN